MPQQASKGLHLLASSRLSICGGVFSTGTYNSDIDQIHKELTKAAPFDILDSKTLQAHPPPPS